MSFGRAGDKIAYRMSGEQWDHQNERRSILPILWRSTAHITATCSKGSPVWPKSRKPAVPDTGLTNGASQMPIYLWYSPAPILERLGFQPAKMTITDLQSQIAGHECIDSFNP